MARGETNYRHSPSDWGTVVMKKGYLRLQKIGLAMRVALCAAMLCTASLAESATGARPPLRVGVVQMAVAESLEANRDRIVIGINQATKHGVRVVVFPEGALRSQENHNAAAVAEAIDVIRDTARHCNVYVVFGGYTYLPHLKKEANWMLVIGPDGRDVFRYEKLYDNHHATMPGVFFINGIPCSAIICADRWLRGVEEIPVQQGAQISFELSNNFASEWVAPFGWYWYVPRALRNNVWVVFANTGNKAPDAQDSPLPIRELKHGHSAIIAPDGQIVAAAHDGAETIVVADIDHNQATRAEARARASSPVLAPFWQAGIRLQQGQVVEAPPLVPLESAVVDITLAAAQVTGDYSDLEPMIAEARLKGADMVIFPERATTENNLERLKLAARQHRITVVVGMETQHQGARRNSAFVIGPDGSILTRYDQIAAVSPFRPGDNPSAMWFRVKGVPAVVTIGRDALWTELAELAAVAGAQIHVHLDNDPATDESTSLRRLQVWCNLASFQTFTATVNVVGSAIWDDLRTAEERRAEVRGLPRPDTGAVEVYSPFSANLVVSAGTGPQLIMATRRVDARNRYHPTRTSNFNPQMDAWYRLGAAIVGPKNLPNL